MNEKFVLNPKKERLQAITEIENILLATDVH
jgi:hypothetical protein